MNWEVLNKNSGIECARGIADWLCNVHSPHLDNNASAGSFPYEIERYGYESPANEWNIAFAVMGLMAASEFFEDEKYYKSAMRMANFLKTLQIFDPFNSEHYGAIREIVPQTPWCYTRDALSAAWAFLCIYEKNGDKEFLQRAKLWAEWFFRKGLDEDGWPLWGIFFEAPFEGRNIQMCNGIQGCFQGGSLNFLYHLYQATNDQRWVGPEYINIADMLIKYIQQDNGLFASVERSTKKIPANDPQDGHHRINDDLNSLGLLTAFKITGNRNYLQGVEKYLNVVVDAQQEDGSFDNSMASIPVVLNIVYEVGDMINTQYISNEGIDKAFRRLLAAQCNDNINPRMQGGIIEQKNGNAVCARSSAYALIVLLKILGGGNRYLSLY